jgi:hypothetical protein
MDAQLVWATWRRILRNDTLVERVIRPHEGDSCDCANLSSEEFAILAEYAKTPAATETNIGMYRNGLVRNALAALSLVPLTRRVLFASGLDVDVVATNFVLTTGYRDDGPHLWKVAGEFVDYLARLREFDESLRQDILAFDTVLIELARRLCDSPPSVWPETAAKIFSKFSGKGSSVSFESTRFVSSRAATVTSSNYDLTLWVEDPDDFDVDEEIEHSIRHWLIYFPASDPTPAYAELSENTLRVFNLLSTPKTASEVSTALGGLATIGIVESLAELGVVVREEDSRTQD